MKKYILTSLLLTTLISSPIIPSCHQEQIVQLSSVELNKTELTLAVDQIFQLEAQVNPGDSTYKLTWVSTNAEVATVSNTGLVKARSFGEIVIKVISDDGKSAECKCIVKEKDIVSIEFEQNTSVLFYEQTV